jgi:hypothetical protein
MIAPCDRSACFPLRHAGMEKFCLTILAGNNYL